MDLKCPDCLFYWKEPYEDYPGCHWISRCPDDKAPCEEEDVIAEEIDPFDERW